jgi:DNA-directed DNA polymerase III PolC
MSFVHLHCHSEYSLLDGANRIEDLIKRAQQFEMPALAITDHGNMHAAWDFQEKARKAGVKPILGMEAYVAPGDRRTRGRPAPGVKPYYHLVLLARDLVGYRNLVKLTSLGYTEGFYTKPRIDRELLAAHSEGLIVSSACLAGEVASHLMDDRLAEAREAAAWYAELFKDRYYLEVQAHASEGQSTLNAKVLSLADDLGLPVVATNDAHFLTHDDHEAHDVLLCIGLGKDRNDKDRMRYDDGLYFKSADEIRPFFPGREDVLTNTLAIAESVDVQFAKQYYVPSFPLPDGVATENDYLVHLATEGAKVRYGDPLPANVQERLDYELGVITKTGYAGYFLITADFIKAARDRGIPVGPGRGSAAGSLVAYATKITDVCPLEFDLLFERFLNPERVSMPDVDVDFCFERRGEVIEYVRQKYGKDSVGQIVTFGTMKSRAAVKDVGRTLGFTPAETDALAKLIPNAPNFSLTVKEAIEQVPEVKQFYQSDPRYRQLLDFAVRLEGLSRHTGVHAAGVVIAPGPLTEFVPICTQATKGSGSDGDERVIVTQYDMTALEKAGMLKMDFLGLTTLTVIADTIKAIKARTGVDVVLEERGFTDEKTYQVLRAGRTGGVFQFESPLATDVLKRMRCDRFDDLVASNALLRPGPLDAGMHNVYIRRKRGDEPTAYALPELEPILSNTYGVITYQEQVMRIAQVLAGISLAEADVLRKAVGKKDAELIKKELGKFSTKAIGRGYDPKIIEELSGQIETFGRYGFNKCLVGDTEIFDAATGRLVRIEDVYEGRAQLGAVATCDVDTLRLTHGRVVDVMDNGVRPVFRLRTESGREIVATGNHPFLMVDGWRALEGVAVGEHIAVPREETLAAMPLHVESASSNDVLWDRVVSIEPAGEQRTYDLEIADSHNFVANDIIVHNSHSVAYSVVAYHTAFLKTHHPAEFMAALLSSNIGKTEEIIKYIAEAREMGLEVLAPDVNESGWRFTVVGDQRIRFGLGAIRNVGRGAIDSLLAARAEGPFTSLYGLCSRVDLRVCNKRVFEALVAAGACDALGGHRAQLIAALDSAISEASLQQDEAEKGQVSLFGDLLAGPEETLGNRRSGAPTLPNTPVWSESERLQREKELLGFYISGHPLEPYRTECELFASHTVSQLGTWCGESVTIGVVVTAIRKQVSKRTGAEFARLTVEDFSGSSEVLVFPEAWGVIAERVRPDVPLLLKGGYSRKDQDVENATFIVESVTRFAEVRASGELAVAIELDQGFDLPPAVFDDVRAKVEAHEGSAPLELRWRDGDGKPIRFRSKSLTVTASPAILSDLRALLGADRVRLVRADG